MGEQSLPIGTEFAGITIAGVLGQGGFGITYRVTDKNGFELALKEYFPADDAIRVDGITVQPKPDRKTRFKMGYDAFLAEARTLNSLPARRGLVQIMGAFEKHRTVYALMDFIDGEPLDRAATRLIEKRKAVPVDLLRELVVAVLSALHAVHRVGVIHRDIKPANVMIRRDGQPILIDFGAARPMAADRTGASMFSRRYAALEQFPQRVTGYRSVNRDSAAVDIFGLSVMLYELVSQSLPPDAEERFKALKRTGADPYLPIRDNILRNRIPMSYPDDLLDAIDAGCGLLPNQRLQSVQQMAKALDSFVRSKRRVDTDPQTPVFETGKPMLAKLKKDHTIKLSGGALVGLFVFTLVVGSVAFGIFGYLE